MITKILFSQELYLRINFYNMSFKNTSKSQLKQFLLQLAKMYEKMCTQLFTFSNTQAKNLKTVSASLEKSTIKNSMERKVKIINQLHIFRQTLNIIQAYVHKKDIKKSEVVMKFVSVSQVLANRISSQVALGKQEKTNILQIIQKNKESVLKYFQKAKDYKQQNQGESLKITDSYILKFAYTETTRATTTAISRVQSAWQTLEQRGSPRLQRDKNTIQENNENSFLEQKNKRKRNETTISQVKAHKSKKYHYNKIFCPTENVTKKVNNFTLKEAQSQNSIVLNRTQLKQTEYPTINTQKKQEICNSNIKDSKINRSRKLESTIKLQKQFSEDSQQATQQEKKSLYYPSQNYLKSCKKIEGVNTLNHKKKQKVSARIQNNHEIFKNVDQINLNILQTPATYDSRKFVTQKQIFDESKCKKMIKSQKSIPKYNITVISQAFQKSRIKNKINKISGLSKIKRSFLAADQNNMFKKITPQKDAHNNIKKQYLSNEVSEGQNEIKQTKNNPQGKKIKEIYAELLRIRKDFVQKGEPAYSSFSSFFNKQLFLQQQENRRLQKLLKQSKNYCYLQEFQLKKYTTKLQKQCNIYKEQAFIAGIRNHLKSCNVLRQIGPQDNEP